MKEAVGVREQASPKEQSTFRAYVVLVKTPESLGEIQVLFGEIRTKHLPSHPWENEAVARHILRQTEETPTLLTAIGGGNKPGERETLLTTAQRELLEEIHASIPKDAMRLAAIGRVTTHETGYPQELPAFLLVARYDRLDPSQKQILCPGIEIQDIRFLKWADFAYFERSWINTRPNRGARRAFYSVLEYFRLIQDHQRERVLESLGLTEAFLQETIFFHHSE